MDMVRLNSQREDVPSFLLAFCFKKLLTPISQVPYKNGLPSFGTPDEMIDNEMDSMLIPLVFKLAFLCRFHSRKYTAKSTNRQQVSG